MMKVVDDWEKLAGKTIEKVEELSDDMALVFSDDTYAVVRSGPNYDGDRSAPELNEVEEPRRWTHESTAYALAQLGIWSNEDYVKWKLLRETGAQEDKETSETRERALLAQLKAKYEPERTDGE